MRIYWFWPHPHRRASGLARSTLRDGDTLTVQALRPLVGEDLPKIQEYEVVRNLPGPVTSSGSSTRTAQRVVTALRRSRARHRAVESGFDVLHLQLLIHYTDWAAISRLNRCAPTVGMVHDVVPHQSGLPTGLMQASLRRIYSTCRELIVYHDVLKEELVSEFGVDAERVHVIPIPLDARLAEPPAMEEEQPIDFLLFGSLRRNKGIDLLLEAARIIEHTSDASIWIVGSGTPSVEAWLRDAAATRRNVHIELGRVSEKRKEALFRRARWVVLPYTSFHSQSGVLADAYRFQRPVVASDVGALGPTVRSDGTGVLVAPGDVEELATALLTASQSNHVWSVPLSEAARAHDYANVGVLLRSIYDTAVERWA